MTDTVAPTVAFSNATRDAIVAFLDGLARQPIPPHLDAPVAHAAQALARAYPSVDTRAIERAVTSRILTMQGGPQGDASVTIDARLSDDWPHCRLAQTRVFVALVLAGNAAGRNAAHVAVEWVERCLAQYGHALRTVDLGRLMARLAWIYRYAGEYTRSLQCMRLAEGLTRDERRAEGLPITTLYDLYAGALATQLAIARRHLDRDDPRAAHAAFALAQREARRACALVRHGTPARVPNVLSGWVEASIGIGDRDGARRRFLTRTRWSPSLARRADPFNRAMALAHLGLAYGHPHRAERALLAVEHEVAERQIYFAVDFHAMAERVAERTGAPNRALKHARARMAIEGRMREDMQQQRSKLATVDRERRRVGAVEFLVHDVRAPLVAMIAEFDEPRRDDPAYRRHALVDSSRRALRLIDNFLALERVDAADEHPAATVLVSEVAERACDAVEHHIAAAGRAIDVRRRIHDEAWIDGHESLLERAIFNVLHNAMQAIEAHGWIDVEVRRHLRTVIVCVRDSGPGFPRPSDGLPGEVRVRSATPSHGIGLEFVYRTVRSHEGAMRCFNAPPQGAVVELTLPAAARAPALDGGAS